MSDRPATNATHDLCRPFVARMKDAGLPDLATRAFCHHLAHVASGDTGILGHGSIEPVAAMPDADDFGAFTAVGEHALSKVVVIKLNGGLGTSMGLDAAKSLLDVRDGMSFLDLTARQVLALRDRTGAQVPLLFMNSFRTHRDTLNALEPYSLEVHDLPLAFLQHRVPKVAANDLSPARHPGDPELEWCPPGHGDLYTALATSSSLDRLLAQGIEYAFASNVDNLGAVIEPSLLGYMVVHGIDFMMEAADRTPADRKGGHLCRLTSGALALREIAQCPPDEVEEFQDVELYRHFNTNNVWFHLPTLHRLLDEHRGVLPLSTIVNRKTLDPRNPESPPVIQLETAMGSAISAFPGAAAIRVPRQRFSPVKGTIDLLAVRSDAYLLTSDSRLVLHPDRSTPPTITLEDRSYKLVDNFEARFPQGPPSLRACDSLTVEGDVVFEGGVVVTGKVRVRAKGRAVVREGTVLSGDVELD